MILSSLISASLLVAVLAALLVLLCVGFYADRPPSGADAMGLIVPLAAAVLCGVMFLIAAWLCVARDGLAWISGKPFVPFTVATVVALGVGLACVGAFILWAERSRLFSVPLALVLGLVGPLALAGVLAVCAWRSPESLAHANDLRVAGLPIVLIALAGLALGLMGLRAQMKLSWENQQRVIARQTEDDARWARKRALAPLERLREEFAECGPQSPLWVFVAALPGLTDDAARQFVVQRSLAVPDFDAQLEQTLTSRYGIYRHGCAEFLRLAADVKPTWAPMLARAASLTAADIRKAGSLAVDKDEDTPAHIASLAAAAVRFGADDAILAALADLRGAVEATAEGPGRGQALGALDAAMNSLHAGIE